MNDPMPQDAPTGTKWLWVAILVFLAVAAVIFFLNADGDESLETIPDEAVTTTEERLNTEITPGDSTDLPPINGEEDGASVADQPGALPTPEDTPLADRP